jgi:hypothetical protein
VVEETEINATQDKMGHIFTVISRYRSPYESLPREDRGAIDINSRRFHALAVLFFVLCFPAPAARAQYCSVGHERCDHAYIRDVITGTINNTWTGCSDYTDYTAMSTTMKICEQYQITITNAAPWSGDKCGTWIDWNQDHDFDDPDERIAVSGGPTAFVGNLWVPIDANLGSTRMRVRMISWADVYLGYSLCPCGFTKYGEVEDYTIVVEPGIQRYGGGYGSPES